MKAIHLIIIIIKIIIIIISNGNRTEWSTIQGVIGRVISNRFTSTIPPELYDTKSYYQLIVSITKCMKLFVVPDKAGRSLAVLVVVLVLLISVSVCISLLSKLSKSIVLNRLSNSKENISE